MNSWATSDAAGRIDNIQALLARVADHAVARREAERLARETEAPDFNAFHFLRSDEYGLSAVIAWLLGRVDIVDSKTA